MRRQERRRSESWKIVSWGLLLVWSWLGYEPCLAAHPTRFALNENCCFWMVAIEPGQTLSFSRRLEGGTRYRLFVMSDSYTTELDVAVADPLGAVIAHSSAAPRETLLRFTPPATGTYTLRLTGAKAQAVMRCSALLLPEQGDWKGAHFHWSDALKQIQRLLLMLEEQGLRAEFPSRGICMVGGIVPAGRAVEFGHLAIDSETSIWAAVGDSRVRSLRMTLLCPNTGAPARDRTGQSLALTAVSEQGVYSPQITVRGDAPESFVIVAILRASSQRVLSAKP